MPSFALKYSKTTQSLEIPEGSRYRLVEPHEKSGLGDVSQAITEALQAPIASLSLQKLARGKEKIAIIVSDITRPSPTDILLPPILAELESAGISDRQITIVFALGSHRAHSETERRALLGDLIFERYLALDADPDDMIDLGVTPRGTPVVAYRPVVEADLRILTGNVEYHYFAGYSGGVKALAPGICSRRTIEKNHSLILEEGAVTGRLEGNPVRADLEAAARIIDGSATFDNSFLVNVTLNAQREIVSVHTGCPIAAHRAGAAVIDEMNAERLDHPYDIVVASAGGYPTDINLYQAQKAIDNVRLAVRPGGRIILLAECAEGLGEAVFARWMEEAKSPAELGKRLRAGFVLGGHKAAALGLAFETAEIALVSSFAEEAARLLFFRPELSAQAAFDRALADYGQDARVLIVPNAGSSLPVYHRQPTTMVKHC